MILKKSKSLNQQSQAYFFNLYNQKSRFYKETCIKTIITNCLEFDDYKTCSKCSEGYFLLEKKCKENPKNFISKCDRYKNSSECEGCLQGYFL